MKVKEAKDMKIEIIDVGKISITSDNPNSIFVGEYVLIHKFEGEE